jgi:GNAT superfamily N-acetyltransferase
MRKAKDGRRSEVDDVHDVRDAREVEQVCERLEWDSAFFGVPIARVLPTRLDEELASRIDAWAAAEGIRCLYFLADTGDMSSVSLAEQRGYRLMDLKVTFEANPAEAPRVAAASRMSEVRRAVPEDIAGLRAIARSSHRPTRFYNDPGFADAQCDELYATWIERSVRGAADCVFTVGPVGEPLVYSTCYRDGRAGLAGVRADMRGRGYGMALYQARFDWSAAERVEKLGMVTQGGNLQAQSMLQRLGARLTGIGLWYHRWLTHP